MKRLQWRAEWAWLAGVVVLLVLGYGLFPGRVAGNMDTFSNAAGGKRAFFTVVERLFPPTMRAMDDLFQYGDRGDALCLLGPARYPDTYEWSWLLDWVDAGNSLIFAARQSDPAVELKYFGLSVVPNERLAERLKRDNNDNNDKNESTSSQSEPAREDAAAGAKEESQSAQSQQPTTEKRSGLLQPAVHTSLATGQFHWQSSGHIESKLEESETLVTSQDGPQVVRVRVGGGTLIVCSSDYIFSNKSLATHDNGLLAVRILEAAEPNGVIFDESLNASGAPRVLGLFFNPTMRPITLQLLIIVVLFGWLGFRTFGPVAAESVSEHRSITEHAAALGNLHWKSSTGGRALHWYLSYFRNELRLHYAGGATASEARVLARRAGTDEQATAKLLDDAKQLMAQPRVSGSSVASIVRELAVIKNKLDHARGN